MEEQKNENLPEEVQAENSTKEDNGEQEKASGRRMLLWGLAGIYLLYTGFSLCKGFINGEEGSQMGFMIAGIAFLVIGAGLIFVAAEGSRRSSWQSRYRSCSRRRTEIRRQTTDRSFYEYCPESKSDSEACR